MTITPSSRRFVALLAYVAIGIVVIHVATLVLMYGFHHDNVMGLTRQFDVDGERNLPAWFSSGLLLFAAVLLGVIASRQKPGVKPRAMYWALLAVVFTYLAFDEGFELHERLGDYLAIWASVHEMESYVWLIPYALFVVAMMVTFSRFLIQLPPEHRKRVMISGAVYVSGAMGFEALGALYVHHYHTEVGILYDIETAIEESLEMAGSILFIRALLLCLPWQRTAVAAIEGGAKKSAPAP